MFKKTLVGIFVLLWIVLAIDPVNRGIWALENVLVVTVFPVVLWADKRYYFNNLTFLSLTLFVILHLFGANLTYNEMTYFEVVSEKFGWERNYYDQLIHFLFGLMTFVTFFEIFYHQNFSKKMSYLIAMLFIISIGSLYEILEWLSMLVFCEELQQSCFFALTQGDIWDAQKDTSYAILGAFLAMLIHGLWCSKERTAEDNRKVA